MFINSLSINQSSEERIRETLSLELNSKDKIIAELQEGKNNLSAEVKVLQDDLKTTETTLDKVNEANIKLNISIIDKLKEEFNARYNEAITLKEESLKLALEREENKIIAIENELAAIKSQYNALINNK